MLDDDHFPASPVLFCLHYLGGSAREWAAVAERLTGARCVALDLPGFGDAANVVGYSVAEMVEYVAAAVRERAPGRFMLAGHSMGAKIALVLTRYIEDGAAEARGLEGLAGLVLLAGSPPSPEPMDESQRAKMMGWFAGDAAANRVDARTYVSANSERLDEPSVELAVNDALRANRAAWLAWLATGSREDWAARVGVVRTPALVLAGQDDQNLGPSAQRDLMLPHLAQGRLVTLPGVKHLLPMERPSDVANAIDEHVASVAYRTLVASARVGAKTREALETRDRPDDPDYAPLVIDERAFATLRAVLERVIPQSGNVRIDLAARIDTQLASGAGDGWRFAALPPDAQAYRGALSTLGDETRRRYDAEFVTLDESQRDDVLRLIADGAFGARSGDATSSDRLDAAQMRLWFEDLRADAVKAYVGHPETLARIGYSGIANGGDGEPKSGFARIGIGQREAWEPVARVDANR